MRWIALLICVAGCRCSDSVERVCRDYDPIHYTTGGSNLRSVPGGRWEAERITMDSRSNRRNPGLSIADGTCCR